jgi:hypothetical protein
VAIGGGKVAKATSNADCDNLVLGKSGDGGNTCSPPPNMAEHPTEVQYDGAANPTLGAVFLAQADSTWLPSNAGYPAALAGWTSTNADIPNGVYGYTQLPKGNGVVGAGAAGTNSNGVLGQSFDPNGVGGAFIGPNRAPLNLQPVMVNQPPATGQCGDLYVTMNVDNHCTLWFNSGISGWFKVTP